MKVFPCTNEEVERNFELVQGVKKGKLPNANLEEVAQFLSRLRQ